MITIYTIVLNFFKQIKDNNQKSYNTNGLNNYGGFLLTISKFLYKC